MAKKKGHRTKHFRNAPFLKALGQHCQKLRLQKGLSIDRLAKESEQLSPSVIHGLETGVSSVTVLVLYRYAQALDLELQELFDFEFKEDATPARAPRPASQLKLIASDDKRVKAEAFKSLLPFYSIQAAAGYFGDAEPAEPEGWLEVDAGHRLDAKMFVVRAVGDSMLPTIRSGDLLVFRGEPSGTKQGKIVLVQYRGPADPETGGSYTVKRYQSSKVAVGKGSWRHHQITLLPENPEFEPIVILAGEAQEFKIVAEYLFTLPA